MEPTDRAHRAPPHGVDLLAFARVSADLAEGDTPLARILEREKLTDAQWTEATLFWTRRMAEDAASPEGPRAVLVFSDAFAQAQDAKKPVPALALEDWAALVTAIEDSDAGLASVLRARRLGLADHARLLRHWAKRLAGDPALARAYDAARTRLADASEGV